MRAVTAARTLLSQRRVARGRQQDEDSRTAQIRRFVDAVWKHEDAPLPPFPTKFLADLEKVYGVERSCRSDC